MNNITIAVPMSLTKPKNARVLAAIWKRLGVSVQTTVANRSTPYSVMYVATADIQPGSYTMVIREGLWELQRKSMYCFI